MKLDEAMKKAKRQRVSELEESYDAVLDKIVRQETGHGPGHPAYEAIVNPPRRGHPRAGENRASVFKGVRLPKDLVDAVSRKAKAAHLSFNAAVLEAVAMWLAHRRGRRG